MAWKNRGHGVVVWENPKKKSPSMVNAPPTNGDEILRQTILPGGVRYTVYKPRAVPETVDQWPFEKKRKTAREEQQERMAHKKI